MLESYKNTNFVYWFIEPLDTKRICPHEVISQIYTSSDL